MSTEAILPFSEPMLGHHGCDSNDNDDFCLFELHDGSATSHLALQSANGGSAATQAAIASLTRSVSTTRQSDTHSLLGMHGMGKRQEERTSKPPPAPVLNGCGLPDFVTPEMLRMLQATTLPPPWSTRLL